MENEIYEDLEDPIIKRVINKIASRSSVGVKKYNTTLQENNHDNYILHAQQEAMDLCNYLEKIMQQGEFVKKICEFMEKINDDKELLAAIKYEYSKLIQRR